MEFVPKPWPAKDVIDVLVSKSGGYFIYTSTVIKFIDGENFSPVERLDHILNISNSAVLPSDSAPFVEINDAGCHATTISFDLGELVRQTDKIQSPT